MKDHLAFLQCTIVLLLLHGLDGVASEPIGSWPPANQLAYQNHSDAPVAVQHLQLSEHAAGLGPIGIHPCGYAVRAVSIEDHRVAQNSDEYWHSTEYAKDECLPPWAHRCSVFGEFLLLGMRDSEVAYGVPINGPIGGTPTPPVQIGPVAVADHDYSAGFRIGGVFALDACTSIVMTYSHFEGNTDSANRTQPSSVIRPLVLHPGTFETNSDALAAAARSSADFDTVDVEYRSVFWANDCSVINWSLGARYAHLQQDFAAIFDLVGEVDTLQTGIGFDGGGIRLGLDGERHHKCGFLVYGETALCLLAGEFSATYLQLDSNTALPVVNTGWKAGRVVPVLELEFGAGWQSRCGRFRLTAGYNFSYWFNAVTTDQWIRSVRENDFVGQSDAMSYGTMTFDGLTTRAEYRF